MTGEKYIPVIRPLLDDRRYHHSLCVADEAKRLSEKYGGDTERAYTAGILHDITKQLKPEIQLQIIAESDIINDNAALGMEKIYHSKSGAAYIHSKLGIDDGEIISAISYHTTARADMTLLEKILYIADFTSADRDYADISVMRILADASLDEAMKYALSYTVTDLVAMRRQVHPDTFEAYNYYVVR